MAAYLVLCVVSGHNFGWRHLAKALVAQWVSIPDSVEQICESCFELCERLSRVTFGEPSSLKMINKDAFCCSYVREIHIPDSEELCQFCFSTCETLSRVTFGESSFLNLIGRMAFGSGVSEIHLPSSECRIISQAFTFGNRGGR